MIYLEKYDEFFKHISNENPLIPYIEKYDLDDFLKLITMYIESNPLRFQILNGESKAESYSIPTKKRIIIRYGHLCSHTLWGQQFKDFLHFIQTVDEHGIDMYNNTNKYNL